MAAPSFDVESIPLDGIFVVGNRRAVNEDAVARLAESIERLGLRTPITIRVDKDLPDPDTGEVMGGYVLVAGRHRLEAYKKLGKKQIPAIVRDCDEREAEMWEIAENLHRAELTALERDEQVARWIELQEAKEVSAQVEQKPQGGRPSRGVSTAAREIGVEKEDARRAVKVASLSAEAKEAAKAAKLDDNRSALLAAAKKDTPEAQVAAIQQHATARAQKPVRLAAEPMSDFEAREAWLATGMAWWNRGSAEWREEFDRRRDKPVMDARYGEEEDIPPFLRRTA